MTRFVVRPAADRDLEEAEEYLADQASPETAQRFLEAAAATFNQLATLPLMGKAWESANLRLVGVRFFRLRDFEHYFAFYRPVGGHRVEILRVLHSARDIIAILEDEPEPGDEEL